MVAGRICTQPLDQTYLQLLRGSSTLFLEGENIGKLPYLPTLPPRMSVFPIGYFGPPPACSEFNLPKAINIHDKPG